jgi:ABC-type Fe3+/spermidine/putrescine transport system ATPase subunit
VNFPLYPHRSCLEIKSVFHHYGQKAALRNVSLEARQSEVLALLGPSGSGKSTLLAVIAGIVKPSAGKILLHGRNLLGLPPESRGLGMVFQDFALWPHMTVAQNVAFPLRARSIAAKEIAGRTESALMRVGLHGFEDRRPHQLSGGQQQRVALARAVVAETQLLLLDEPLSALDPATRASVRGELAEILQRLNITTIIVTHDREEAFELADRIAVLVDGQIQQYSTPEEVYEHPANLTVGRFMGANLLSARVFGDGGVELDHGGPARLEIPGPGAPGPAHLAIVPEQTRVIEDCSGMRNILPGQLIRSQYRGGEYRLRVRVGDTQAGQIVEARAKNSPPEDRLFIHLPAEAIHVIQDTPPSESSAPIDEPIANVQLTKLQEEIV